MPVPLYFVDCSDKHSLQAYNSLLSTNVDHVCCLVVQSTNALTKRNNLKLVHNLLQLQLQRQGPVAISISGPDSALAMFSRYKEFIPLQGHPSVFVFGTTDWSLVLKSKEFYYELGDHADNAIAEVSATRRKPIPIEEHFDDCGDDISAIHLDDVELSTFVKCFETADEPSSDEEFASSFYNTYLWGSDFTSKTPPLVNFVIAYATVCSWPKAFNTDYCEVFGGIGGVTKIAIRRNLKGGQNYDIVAGCDLSDPQHVASLFRYLAVHKPLVAVMGPPCTPFGPRAEYNKRFNSEGWRRSMDIGLPLAILAARIATFQYTQGRYFLVENPWLSKLWYLPCWQVVLKLPGVLCSYID